MLRIGFYLFYYIISWQRSGLAAAMMWTITLPAVKRSEPKSEIQKMNVVESTTETKLECEDGDNESTENSIEVNRSQK